MSCYEKFIYVSKDIEKKITLIPEKYPTKKRLERIELENKQKQQQLLSDRVKDKKEIEDYGILLNINDISKFKKHKNKIILLNFFGTWCPPCKAEIPYLNIIKKKYLGEFEIIGIDMGQKGKQSEQKIIEEFIKKFQIEFPIKYNLKLNNKLFDSCIKINKNKSIPFMILFDKNGKYFKHYIGLVSEEELDRDIAKLMY